VSKEFSSNYIGDVNLVLCSSIYIQYLGGGMSWAALYSKVPFLIIHHISNFELPNDKDKYQPWFSDQQIFIPIDGGIRVDKDKLNAFVEESINSLGKALDLK
jgi:hypothetical protein